MIKRRAKKSLHTKPVKGKSKAKSGLLAKTKARQRRRVQRVARGKPKPGHIVGHSRRRRKGEILCHNHVLHTTATANGVHGFHWFTVCAPAGWDPVKRGGGSLPVWMASRITEAPPRPTMCNGGAIKLKSAEALRLSTVRSVGVSASTATRTWDNQRRPLRALPHRESSLMWKPIAVPKTNGNGC